MSCTQITAWQPRATNVFVRRKNGFHEMAAKFKPSHLEFPCFSSSQTQLLGTSSLKLKFNHCKFIPILNSRRSSPVCLSKSGGDNEGSPWKALEKALGNITKGQSIEDILKQQIKKKEYFEDSGGGGGGGGGGTPPNGGGGGGSGGGTDGSSGPEEEGIMEEVIQAVLATLGFIFLYIYIITGEELLKLFKDYIKYLFKGTESFRLKRFRKRWNMFWRSLIPIKIEDDPFWLEKALLRTTTMYDSPQKDHMIYDAMWAEQQRSLGGSDKESTPESDDNDGDDDDDDDNEYDDDDNDDDDDQEDY